MADPAVEACYALNPYVGPRPFRVGETMYGRDRDARQLSDALIAGRIVLLHAPSGAGKTSIVQAAIVPRLEARGFSVLARTLPQFSALRVNEPPPQFDVANRYVFSIALGLLGEAVNDVSELADMTLPEALTAAIERAEPARRHVVLIDQLEEVLNLDPTDLENQEEFFKQLGEALDGNPRLWALLCIREDYMGGLDRFLHHFPGHLRTTYRLDYLDQASATRAIREPAGKVDVEIDGDAAERLFQNLVTQVIETPNHGSVTRVGRYAEPVLLQVACEQLWRKTCRDRRGRFDRITLDDVPDFADVNAAMRRFYDGCVEIASNGEAWTERAIRDWIGEELITPEGFRSQKPVGDTVPVPADALGVLQERYLIRTETKGVQTWWELSHDQLIEPIRHSNGKWRRAHLDPWQVAAAKWHRDNRDQDQLLTGEEFRRARKSCAQLGEHATAIETDFITESERRQADLSSMEKVQQHVDLITGILAVSLTINVLLFLLVLGLL